MGDFVSGFKNNFLFHKRADIAVAIIVIVLILMMILPIPGFILDVLIALNLVFTLLIVLIVLYSRRALDFSVFPTLLLISTVFDLALNISSTRLIFIKGENFTGHIIKAFGHFVVGSSGMEGIIIGIIIFIIIMAVQFFVITNGSTRIAEVAARFTLDALPGKQMAIDAAYAQGSLTEEEAKFQKEELQREVNFYGAMDGAAKFVSGNVKVGIFIIIINIIGGMVIGIVFRHENAGAAFHNYVSLTIGDGLVSQIPALLVSVATGLLVTRAISRETLATDAVNQFSKQSTIYWIAAVFIFVLAFLPGFPKWILFPLSVILGYVAFRMTRAQNRKKKKETENIQAQKASEENLSVEISPVIPLDVLSLELGYGLIPLVDKAKGTDFLNRITKIRRETALDLGLVVPKIRIVDNIKLEAKEYCFKIKGLEVGKGKLQVDQYLAINPGSAMGEIQGEKTKDPAFGLDALWITEEQKEQAEKLGYTVVDPPTIIATHLTEIIRKYASELLGKQDVKTILDALKDKYSAVVDEINKNYTIGEVQKVLQGLLDEQVSIRNIVGILEVLCDYVNITKDVHFLIEKVRQSLARQICLQYADDKKVLSCIVLDNSLEQMLLEHKIEVNQEYVLSLNPQENRKWLQSVGQTFQEVQTQGYLPILLTSESTRAMIRNALKRDFPDIVVLSIPEIIAEIKINVVGEIKEESGDNS